MRSRDVAVSGRLTPRRHLLLGFLAFAFIPLLAAEPGAAQTNADAPWFGLRRPPPFEPHTTPVIIGSDYGPRPAHVPVGEEGFRELEGEVIRADLAAIVGFSRESRATREIGDGGLWGRVAGYPSLDRTMDWVADRFRQIGVPRVEVQRFEQSPSSSLWVPLTWEVRLKADGVFGEGSEDVVLESAMPTAGSRVPPEGLSAPLVYVGTARPAELAHIDVRGKVAVQHIIPKGHLFLNRGEAQQRAQELMRRGAVAVLNVIEQPGNMRMRDIGNCGGPCFNLGGQDGRFLEDLMDAAEEAGVLGHLRVELRLTSEERSGLRAANVIGVIPGRSSENIIVNAHADAWFDGANDNGDGLAVMVALATHFAKPEHRPERTLVFVASAGHHTPGLNGPNMLVELNREIVADNVLTINLEHLAARQLHPARSVTPGGFRDLIADSGEGYLMNGVSNRSPFLEKLLRDGVDRYGVNFVSEASTYAAGDNPPVDGPLLQVIQATPLYHGSGETLETISTPGLERVARFFAYFLKEVDRAPREELGS